MTLPLVCTSATPDRWPAVRALARSIARHHGGERLVALLLDDRGGVVTPAEAGAEPGEDVAGAGAEPIMELLGLDDVRLDAWEAHEMALCCGGDDLAATLAPALVSALVLRGRPVVWLSPEVVVLAPLVDLVPAHGATTLLVPRLLGAIPDDGRAPTEEEVVTDGVVDPGVVAVAPGAEPFLEWWQRSVRREASSPGRAPARSQPALALAPQLFGAELTRSAGIGVASWNAHERGLTWSAADGYRALGSPVSLVHLQGFDPEVPYLVAPAGTRRPRVLASEVPALWRLCRERALELGRATVPAPGSAAGSSGGARAVALADGSRLDERMRRIARLAVAATAHGKRALPDPFEPDEIGSFHEWLASPDPSDPTAPNLPRYLLEVYRERPDLAWHFPRLGTVDMAHFREWVAHHGLDEARVPPALRDALARTSWWSAPTGVVVAAPGGLRPGVVLAGYLRAESGVGEAARLSLGAMRSAGIDVVPVPIGTTPSRQLHRDPEDLGAEVPPVADRRINLVWVNADQLPGFASVVGPAFFDGRYTIGFWAWETESMPKAMAASSSMLDEIWVPSAYVRDAVASVADRVVHVFPHPVVPPPVDREFDVSGLGIPPGYRFLYTYDFLSGFERKNPLGVLEAFAYAFAPGDGPVLVLKSVNGDRRPAESERLALQAGDRSDVVVLDGYLTASERGALLDSCDCYVSLHRAEGFGLGMAEAMALGKPVIATRYSGNLDLMDDETALLVPARRVAVGPGASPYDPESCWGEPDLGVAAEQMRRVVARPEEARDLGSRARRQVLAEHGVARAERFVRRRIADVEKRLRKGYVSGAAEAVRRSL